MLLVLTRILLTNYFSAAVSKTSKQTTLQFKPSAKNLKKSPCSDEESDNMSESEMEIEEVVAPRERVERKTKGAFT